MFRHLNQAITKEGDSTYFRGGGELVPEYYFDTVIVSDSPAYYDVLVSMTITPPSDYDRLSKVSPVLLNNLRSTKIARVGYHEKDIPPVASKMPATREGLWRPTLPLGHPKTKIVNSAPLVYVGRNEPLHSIGLDQANEAQVRWVWLNDGVEYLTERLKQQVPVK